jgi:hypothetical protein
MSINIGNRIINDNIGFYIDFANKRSFSPNLVNYSNWSVGINGVTNWAQNGNTFTTENFRVMEPDPFGNTYSIIWKASSKDELFIDDPDSNNFITAAGITTESHRIAISQLVLELKSYGIWNSIKAIYPFAGGTSESHKWNLRDTSKFQLQFIGGFTHSSNGVLPDGSTGYAKTSIIPSVDLNLNDVGISFYSRTKSIGKTASTFIGTNNGTKGLALGVRQNRAVGISDNLSVSATSSGDYLHSFSRSSQNISVYIRESIYDTVDTATQTQSASSATALPNSEILLFAEGTSNGTPLPNSFTDHECGFIVIGNSLTSTQVNNLFSSIEAYQSRMGRSLQPAHINAYIRSEDGGFISSFVNVDPSKLYRVSVWTKRSGNLDSNSGSFYLGTNFFDKNSNFLNGKNKNNGATTSNIYFQASSAAVFGLDNWSLVVGHIWPYYTPVSPSSSHINSGIWNKNGTKISNLLQGDYINEYDTKFIRTRSYHYYSTNLFATQSWVYPRIDLVDGNEPSIQELLKANEPIRDIAKGNIISPFYSTNFSKNSLVYSNNPNDVLIGTISNTFSHYSSSIWFKPNSDITKTTPSTCLYQLENPSFGNPFSLILGSSTVWETDEVIAIHHNSSNRTCVKNITIKGSVWNNISLNWNGTTYDIYLNGVLQTTTPGSVTIGGVTSTHVGLKLNVDYFLMGGALTTTTTTSPANLFSGSIGSLIIYERSLTTNEILFNYNVNLQKYSN